MTLNPWKQVRQLKGIIGTLQTLIGSLQKVIETQGKLIATLRSQIELQAIRKITPPDPDAGKYLN